MNTVTEINAPHDILYINVSRIGDTLLITPAVRSIAARWPLARIHLLAHPKREEVVRHLPFVYRTGTIEKKRARFKGFFPGKRYDLAFVSNYDPALIKYALRVAHHVIAFRQPSESLNSRLYRAVERPGAQSMHAVDLELYLPAALGIEPTGKSLAYCITDKEATWAHEYLTRHDILNAHPLIGLQIASFPTKAYRDWPVEQFAELCRRILGVWPKSHFLIFGGKLEKKRTENLANLLGNAATLCAGRLTLRETASLMNILDLYIGVDTGPTHIMGALHRPMVALYHGFSPSWLLRPLDNPLCHVVDHPRAGHCTPEATMSEITVDRVWDAVRLALAYMPRASL